MAFEFHENPTLQDSAEMQTDFVVKDKQLVRVSQLI